MGEQVLSVDAGDPLPEEVRGRLATLDGAAVFDGAVEAWERVDEDAQYREARVEPGDPVHVAGATVESVPDEWGTGVAATVGTPDADDGFTISEGAESGVVRDNLVQFTTGVAVGLALFGLGLHVLDVLPSF